MRNKKHFKNKPGFTLTLTLILIVFLLGNVIFSVNTKAQEENSLNILITNTYDEPISQIEENTYFKISVYNSTGVFLSDVKIDFNRNQYLLDDGESLELKLMAPSVTENTTFNITASKSGYNQPTQV